MSTSGSEEEMASESEGESEVSESADRSGSEYTTESSDSAEYVTNVADEDETVGRVLSSRNSVVTFGDATDISSGYTRESSKSRISVLSESADIKKAKLKIVSDKKSYLTFLLQMFIINSPDFIVFVCFAILTVSMIEYVWSSEDAQAINSYTDMKYQIEIILESKASFLNTIAQMIEGKQFGDLDVGNNASILQYEVSLANSFWTTEWNYALYHTLWDRSVVDLHLEDPNYYSTKIYMNANDTHSIEYDRRRNRVNGNFYDFNTTTPKLVAFNSFAKDWYQIGNSTEEEDYVVYGPRWSHADASQASPQAVVSLLKKVKWPESENVSILNFEVELGIFTQILEVQIPFYLQLAIVNKKGDVLAYMNLDRQYDRKILYKIFEIHEFDSVSIGDIYDNNYVLDAGFNFYEFYRIGNHDLYLVAKSIVYRIIEESLFDYALFTTVVFVVVFVSFCRIVGMLFVFLKFKLSLYKKATLGILEDVLPKSFAKRVMERKGNEVVGDLYPSVTVVFIDIVRFSETSKELSPYELLCYLNSFFSLLDRMCSAHNMTKIKTIGDAYLAVCGCPEIVEDHAVTACKFAQAFMRELRRYNTENPQYRTAVRIGINSGYIVAGVVGEQKMVFDIWGSTVNFSERIERSADVNKINIGGSTYALIREEDIKTKYLGVFNFDKTEMDIYQMKF